MYLVGLSGGDTIDALNFLEIPGSKDWSRFKDPRALFFFSASLLSNT